MPPRLRLPSTLARGPSMHSAPGEQESPRTATASNQEDRPVSAAPSGRRKRPRLQGAPSSPPAYCILSSSSSSSSSPPPSVLCTRAKVAPAQDLDPASGVRRPPAASKCVSAAPRDSCNQNAVSAVACSRRKQADGSDTQHSILLSPSSSTPTPSRPAQLASLLQVQAHFQLSSLHGWRSIGASSSESDGRRSCPGTTAQQSPKFCFPDTSSAAAGRSGPWPSPSPAVVGTEGWDAVAVPLSASRSKSSSSGGTSLKDLHSQHLCTTSSPFSLARPPPSSSTTSKSSERLDQTHLVPLQLPSPAGASVQLKHGPVPEHIQAHLLPARREFLCGQEQVLNHAYPVLSCTGTEKLLQDWPLRTMLRQAQVHVLDPPSLPEFSPSFTGTRRSAQPSGQSGHQDGPHDATLELLSDPWQANPWMRREAEDALFSTVDAFLGDNLLLVTVSIPALIGAVNLLPSSTADSKGQAMSNPSHLLRQQFGAYQKGFAARHESHGQDGASGTALPAPPPGMALAHTLTLCGIQHATSSLLSFHPYTSSSSRSGCPAQVLLIIKAFASDGMGLPLTPGLLRALGKLQAHFQRWSKWAPLHSPSSFDPSGGRSRSCQRYPRSPASYSYPQTSSAPLVVHSASSPQILAAIVRSHISRLKPSCEQL